MVIPIKSIDRNFSISRDIRNVIKLRYTCLDSKPNQQALLQYTAAVAKALAISDPNDTNVAAPKMRNSEALSSAPKKTSKSTQTQERSSCTKSPPKFHHRDALFFFCTFFPTRNPVVTNYHFSWRFKLEFLVHQAVWRR